MRHVHVQCGKNEGHGCPVCNLDPARVYADNDLAVAVLDGYPVSPGHSLIIPKRHFESLFDATEEERVALFNLLDEARTRLLEERQPDGFNIGINDWITAGQTVMHLHIHLIPRYVGDCDDPRGGVLWVFPERAAYWKKL
ncbi:MAG: HIT family protein [Deltaproteobacteria bacterium]|nr:HIT family protein [Deltaproteobacteria bacterium]